MNTLVKALNEKLETLGYNESVRNNAISKMDISLIENKLNDVDDYSKYIEVYQYEEPCVEIIRAFLNTNNSYIYSDVLEGDIHTESAETAFRTRFAVANYSLFKRSAVITVANDFKTKIYIYSPNQRTQAIYEGKTYEDIYKKERDSVTLEYKEAFDRNRRLQEQKTEEILTMLISDFVIDEMIVKNINPRLKMYDDPEKYAENITSYSLRFINNRTNRIEIYEREPNLRRLGNGVISGICSNDPYIRLDEIPTKTDFALDRISYYWLLDNGKRQEEISIFTANKQYEYKSYSEMKKNSVEVKMIIDDIAKSLKRTEHISEDYSGYISEIVKSLNIELVNPTTSVIREGLEQDDVIIPIAYRYRFLSDPKEFEEKLYISLEDNLGRDYKYKISENAIEDLTRIGMKLEYTDEKGESIKRQSIADFNVNGPTAIIRKETFIDSGRVSNLLAYLYHDTDEAETDKLPIPSVEVYIYIPKEPSTTVCMYNGTSLNFTLESMKENSSLYGDIVKEKESGYIEGGTSLPGSTYVTVRYINSKNEILKENKIGNLFPNSNFTPEIIPIINDVNGKEWRAEQVRVDPLIVNSDPKLNVITLKYIERYTRVTFSFINREGKKIADDKQEIIQVGETYDFENKKTIIANDKDEWHLKFSRPSKFIAKDSEDRNKVILVYDIERTDILIKYLNKNTGEELAESKRSTVAANKKYAIDVPKYLLSKDNLGWNYIEGTDINILAKPNILNEVDLYYTEAKAPVTIVMKNEAGIKLADDRIELVQIGKKFSYSFDDDLTDYQCREWKIKTEQKNNEIIVKPEKEKNVIEAIYVPVLANITIKFVNTENRPIKSDNIESAQVGEMFNSARLEEITDNYQKMWKCIDNGGKIVVKSREVENEIILKYEPLMTTITIKYMDAESNELMEPKKKTMQVGSTYKDRPIEKFTSNDGKRWKVDLNKIEEFVAKRYDEENIFSIYYDKETAKVNLSFYDAYNNKLKAEQEIEWQIGAKLETKMFERITDDKGQRWMIEASEPRNLIVKENNNHIKLIYGEVKAKVLVKHIDIKSGKPIIDNIITTVRLGGIYLPNIQKKVLDSNKWQWKYIGDEDISIVTKENEQENIIVLNYEADTSKVVLKYQNQENQKIRENSVKDVQIGKEIRIDPILKFTDNIGLVWKYHSIKIDNKYVEEKENNAIATYEPLISNIHIKFVNENDEDIVEEKIIKMQAGKTFVPDIIERLTDRENKVWVYNKISAEKIIVKENEKENEIKIVFTKLMSDIKVQLVDETENLIAKENVVSKQVGEIYVIPFESKYVDEEGKAWILNRTEKEKITTNENSEQNIIKVWYDKEMIGITLKYFSILNENIKKDTSEKAQIGSVYKISPVKEIIDEKTKLGWKLPDEYNETFKIQREEDKNIINIKYEALKVKVTVKYKDEKGNDILEDTIYKEQVGTTFKPKIENVVTDKEDKEWLYGLAEETKIFGNFKAKTESVYVERDENKNCIDLKYRPSLISVTIKYQEPLGRSVKQDKIVEAQIGSIYEAEIIDTIIDNQNVKWVYNPNSKPNIKVGHDEKENIIVLAYEEEKALVTYKYHDEYGNRLRSPKRKLVQIGSTYQPEVENVIEDYQGRVWEYKAKSTNSLSVKEDESMNIIEVIYIPLKVDTVLRFVNLQGKQIVKDVVVKAQLGSEYTPDINEKITDDESRLFKFVKINPEESKIKEIPVGALESPNLFELTYEAVYSNAVITYKTIDGKKIKQDDVKQLQVGTMFDPVPAQYIKDSEGIQWELISKDIDSIRIMEDERQNVVSMVYEVAKAEITIRYKDMDGNSIFKSDILQMEVGKEFVPEIKNELVDENNKKWVFAMVEPVKLTVGSINNIINVTYQEKKVQVIVKYRTKDGKVIKEDSRIKVQVGTRFEPKNTTRVIYDANEIWRFSYNEPSIIMVSENVSENIITQVYTKEEREVEKQEENKPYYNPEVEKFIDKELVEETKQEEEREKEQKQSVVEEKEIEFEADNLKPLTKNITLSNSEKIAITQINEYNKQIMNKLNIAISDFNNVNYETLENEITEMMNKEKQVVQKELQSLIENDKSGRDILKIYEAVTEPELEDKNFSNLQQRRSVLSADYFINNAITDVEQAMYICEKGKVEKEIECVTNAIERASENTGKKNKGINKDELIKIKIKLIYEKLIINNFNKARSTLKDDYFKNEESRQLLPASVVVTIANTLPKQALKLLSKITNLTLEQEIELEALIEIMNTQQLGTLEILVQKIQDGKTRKLAMKYLKELSK